MIHNCIWCKQDRPVENFRNGLERFILCEVCRTGFVKAKAKARRDRTKEANAIRQRIWRQANKGRIMEYVNRRSTQEPMYRLSRSIRTLLNQAFKIKNVTKARKTVDILGCDITTFKTHIESQFLPDMGWHNRSAWHIDHIMPLAGAHTEEELYKLNHYTNLRPLWAKDNLSKGSTIDITALHSIHTMKDALLIAHSGC